MRFDNNLQILTLPEVLVTLLRREKTSDLGICKGFVIDMNILRIQDIKSVQIFFVCNHSKRIRSVCEICTYFVEHDLNC